MEPVRFSLYELLVIESVLTPTEAAMEHQRAQDALMPSKELCLKVGSALLQARERDGEVVLALSEQECWVVRERVNIFASVGSKQDVGLTVKLKVYHMLLEYAFAQEVGDIEVSDHNERSAREVRDALAHERDRNPNPHNPKDGPNPKA